MVLFLPRWVDCDRLLLGFFRHHSQIVARHLLRLRDAQHAQHRRSYVLQRAVGLQGEAASIALKPAWRDRMFCHDEERNRIGGVRGLRASGAGSIICSALPWSAVIIMAPPAGAGAL